MIAENHLDPATAAANGKKAPPAIVAVKYFPFVGNVDAGLPFARSAWRRICGGCPATGLPGSARTAEGRMGWEINKRVIGAVFLRAGDGPSLKSAPTGYRSGIGEHNHCEADDFPQTRQRPSAPRVPMQLSSRHSSRRSQWSLSSDWVPADSASSDWVPPGPWSSRI